MMETVYRSEAGRKIVLDYYREILDEWPCPWELKMIGTSYGETGVVCAGARENPPLLLLHGSGANAASWGADIRELSRHFHVLAADIPGEPGFSDPLRFTASSGTFTLWLEELTDALELHKAFLAGQSLGAWAALRYALDRPQRVGKICLISPSGLAPVRRSLLPRLLWFGLQGERGVVKLFRQMHNSSYVHPAELKMAALLKQHFRYRRDRPPLFTPEDLQSLKQPVLYTAGEKDIFLNTGASLRQLRQSVPQLQVRIFPEGGHALVGLQDALVPFFLKIPGSLFLKPSH